MSKRSDRDRKDHAHNRRATYNLTCSERPRHTDGQDTATQSGTGPKDSTLLSTVQHQGRRMAKVGQRREANKVRPSVLGWGWCVERRRWQQLKPFERRRARLKNDLQPVRTCCTREDEVT